MAQQSFFSTNLGLSSAPEFDSKKYPEIYSDLLRIRGAIRGLQAALDQYTGALPPQTENWPVTTLTQTLLLQNTAKIYVVAGVAISPGQILSTYNDAGVLKAQLATATDPTKLARGFASITAAAAAGDYIEMTLLGADFYISGLTPGTPYYLSNTAGAIATTAGLNVQKIGHALSATCLFFNPAIA